MSNEKKNVPELRFPAFEDEWEEYFLEDKSDLITKGTTPKEWKNDGEVNFIKVENIDQDSGKVKISSKISYLEHVKHLRRSILEEGDILFSIAGTLGRITIIDKEILPANTNQALAIIRNQSINKYYLKTYLLGKSIKEYIRKNPTIGAQPNLSLKQIKSFKIKLPESEEQEKIGDFFSILDKQIELEEKKLELLEQQKKGYMQKIFSQELRFKDENGNDYPEWNKKEIQDLMEVASVKRIHQSDWQTNGVQFLRARDIVAYNKKEKIEEPLYISYNKYNEYSKISGKVEKGDLLVTGVGTIGIPFLIKDDKPLYFKDGNIIWIKNKKILDENFLFYSFLNTNVQNYIKRVAGVGTVGTYTIVNAKKTPIFEPIKDEQKKIGILLKRLDELAKKQSLKIELLKQQKQGLLQKMFI